MPLTFMMPHQQNRFSNLSLFFCAALALTLSAHLLHGAEKSAARRTASFAYPPIMPEARAETYKTVGQTNLQLYIFTPKDHAATNRRPAIVFFFGGGWTSGSPQQFEKQCQYFASRGMVAITADYRVASRQRAKPVQCVADARSAIRWVRKNAARLGVDPNRIVAAGGSAGGHLAGCIAVVPGLDEPGEDTSISAVPNAAVLFNPVLVLAPLDGQDSGEPGFAAHRSSAWGSNRRAFLPPTTSKRATRRSLSFMARPIRPSRSPRRKPSPRR